MAVTRIVSGGQTGVDRGALDAAIELGIEHGGYCPRGRRAEDGVIPARYRLTEMSSRSYAARTEANVEGSDATLIIAVGRLSGGTALTAGMARKHRRPLLVLGGEERDDVTRLRAWIAEHGIATLNVAGPRESSAPGLGERACRLLVAALGELA